MVIVLVKTICKSCIVVSLLQSSLCISKSYLWTESRSKVYLNLPIFYFILWELQFRWLIFRDRYPYVLLKCSRHHLTNVKRQTESDEESFRFSFIILHRAVIDPNQPQVCSLRINTFMSKIKK